MAVEAPIGQHERHLDERVWARLEGLDQVFSESSEVENVEIEIAREPVEDSLRFFDRLQIFSIQIPMHSHRQRQHAACRSLDGPGRSPDRVHQGKPGAGIHGRMLAVQREAAVFVGDQRKALVVPAIAFRPIKPGAGQGFLRLIMLRIETKEEKRPVYAFEIGAVDSILLKAFALPCPHRASLRRQNTNGRNSRSLVRGLDDAPELGQKLAVRQAVAVLRDGLERVEMPSTDRKDVPGSRRSQRSRSGPLSRRESDWSQRTA